MPPAANPRQRIAAVGWSLAFGILGYLAVVNATLLLFDFLLPRMPSLVEGRVGPSLIQAVGIAIFAPLSWLIGRRRLSLTRDQLGWASVGVGARGFGRGLLVAIPLAAVALIAGLPAHSTWVLDGGTLVAYLARLPFLALILLPAALFEELAFRGVLVAGLVRGMGRSLGLGLAASTPTRCLRGHPAGAPYLDGGRHLGGGREMPRLFRGLAGL